MSDLSNFGVKSDVLNILVKRYRKIKPFKVTLCGNILKGTTKDGRTEIIKLNSKDKINEIKRDSSEDPLRELMMLKNLQGHKNIISLLNVHETLEDGYFLAVVLQYCKRGDMFELLQKSSMAFDQATKLFWLRSIAEGISYMHEKKICHLDLSLENVVITCDLQVKIADFGQARFFEREVRLPLENGKRSGREMYRDPEIQARRPFYGDKADLFSFGVLSFILLCGVPPFMTPSKEDSRFIKIFDQPFSDYYCQIKKKRNHHVSQDAGNLIENLLCMEDRRYCIDYCKKILNMCLQNSL